jgi:flagellar hook-length control protein FliK
MTLPQAANSLLGGTPDGGIGEMFAQLLEDGLALSGDDAAAGGPKGLAQSAALQQLMGKLAARGDGVADLAQVLSASTAVAPLSAPGTSGPHLSPQLTANLLDMGVPQQVGGKGWGGAIADRVMWMVQGEQQFAKLRLNPPNLGPLEVRVMVHQDQTSVSFLAHQAAVREALEAALPRLREMFEQQSMQLVRADVSDPGAQQQDAPGDTPQQPLSGSAGPDGEPEQGGSAHAMSLATGTADGLIDLFA